MWPTLRDGFILFFTDKTYFASKWDRWVAKVRAVIMAIGASGAVYGDQISAAYPQHANKVKLGGIVLMGVALALRAGDKTPANVRALANDIQAGG